MARRLRPEEEDLWRRVTSQATPLSRASSSSFPQEQDGAPRPKKPQPISNFRVGESAVPAARPQPLKQRPHLRLDRRTQKDLSRGKRRPEATIDLHGLTVDQAHLALNRFILASFATGRRLVLVVTGKGGGSGSAWDRQRGVLRRYVPEWLAGAALESMVQEVVPAHKSHGGSGAFYVILRRS